jgi:hypothetical protein
MRSSSRSVFAAAYCAVVSAFLIIMAITLALVLPGMLFERVLPCMMRHGRSMYRSAVQD